MKTNRIILQFTFLLFAGLLLSGCTLHKSATDSPALSGVYALVSVDGKTLPADVSHGGGGLQVRSGIFTFNDDETCRTRTVFLPPSGTEVTREVSAAYEQADSKITMKWEGAGTTVGTIKGDTFSMNNEGMIFVYRKN